MRRKYDIKVLINDQFVTKAIIDPHYEEKHGESINDEIILQLIQKLDGKSFEPDDVKENFSYFATDGIILSDKSYKLIWLLEENEIYIGVVNAYRRS